jgi:H+/Cl- antiporter ClcA
MTLTQFRDGLGSAGGRILSFQQWKSRIVLWTAAVLIGIGAVRFAELVDVAQNAFRWIVGKASWSPWLIAPLGFALISWLTKRFFRGAEGSGIPQTIFLLQSDTGEVSSQLMRPRVVLARMSLAAAALVCGASIGREGPTVHVGAGIAQAFDRWVPHGGMAARRRSLILAGGTAGVAAAFNTPLAGIVFAIEELSRSFEARATGATIVAVLIAGVTAIVLIGNYTYFGQPVITSVPGVFTTGTLAVALAGRLLGGLFSRVLLLGTRAMPWNIGALQRKHPLYFGAACGVLVATIGLLSGGLTFGSGYSEARSILTGPTHMGLFYAPARALATLITYLGGVPAGLMAPSLSVGAGLGELISRNWDQGMMVPYAISGMCGYLVGVRQAPISSFVIVIEMTNQRAMVLPLMIIAVIATAVSKFLSLPLYQALARQYAL